MKAVFPVLSFDLLHRFIKGAPISKLDVVTFKMKPFVNPAQEDRRAAFKMLLYIPDKLLHLNFKKQPGCLADI